MLGPAVIAVLLFAQAGRSPSPPAPPAQVGGQAVHSRTREALRKTQVTLIPVESGGKAQSQVIITDSEGRFQFRDVRPGKYALTAIRAGFIPARHASPAKPLEVKSGQVVRDLELALTPQSVLAGKVVDPDGDPVPNAQITALRMTVYGGFRQVQSSATTLTNDIGEFRLPGLFAGRYLLMASYRREPTSPEDQFLVVSGEDYAPTYYPNANTSAAASPIDIGTGEDSLNNVIRIRRLPVFTVSGSISGTRERQGLRLYLVSDDRDALRAGFALQQMASLQGQDRFTFPAVVPGAYQVIAIRGGKRATTVARMPVTIGYTAIEDLGVTLLEPVRINGRLRVEGRPEANVSKIGIRLQPVEALLPQAIDMQVDKESRFEAEAASREKHLLLLRNLPEDYYIRSIRVANQDATTAGVDLTYAPPLTEIDVVLGSNPGIVEGVVIAGSNVAARRVVTLVPDPPEPNQPWRTQQATSDAFGRFRFGGLSPGSYRIHAWNELQADQYGDPNFLRHFESKGVPVEVREGITAHVEVAAIEEN
jgi:hypothetical protein